ncbi:hypothetical protein [Aureispira anguillae]|uniref:Uncharacterized protein n=1 Tax=Aureispira anguillae TaxID=2864201 RepID=A0A915YG41_9BACT|nr:hypothetical protein [Aureispira anguillae]BDS12390.1 hypothetical protein AsAng_0031110 [Aureispira anguillae]
MLEKHKYKILVTILAFIILGGGAVYFIKKQKAKKKAEQEALALEEKKKKIAPKKNDLPTETPQAKTTVEQTPDLQVAGAGEVKTRS